MDTVRQQPIAQQPITLRGELDGRRSAELREAIYDHIASHPDADVVLDLSEVESLDRTVLQMLAAVALRLERAGRHLVLRGCPPPLRRMLAMRRWHGVFRWERHSV